MQVDEEPLPAEDPAPHNLEELQRIYRSVYSAAHPGGSEDSLKQLDILPIADDARAQIADVFRSACKEAGKKSDLYKILAVHIFAPRLIEILCACKDEKTYRAAVGEFATGMYKESGRALVYTMAEVMARQGNQLREHDL